MVTDAGFDDAGQDANRREASGQDHGNSRNSAGGREGTGSAAAPDPQKLAQDWITLWQSELVAMAADRETQEAWHSIAALWGGLISTSLQGLRGAAGPAGHEQPPGQPGATAAAADKGTASRAADAAGAAPAAAAPDPRDVEIERLAGHVAALESRLAELERRGDPAVDPQRRARRKPRK